MCPDLPGKQEKPIQTKQTITLFGTVSNSATSRFSKNGRKYTAFGVSLISDRDRQAFHYNVVAFGKQGHFAALRSTRGHSCIIVIMADTWFTSDFHLGHFNIIRYCNRPFADTREMDEVIVDRLNASVKPNDTLYFLGDFCLGKHDNVAEYRNRLACQTIHFVDGNHDKATRQLQHLFSSWSSLSEISIGKQGMVLKPVLGLAVWRVVSPFFLKLSLGWAGCCCQISVFRSGRWFRDCFGGSFPSSRVSVVAEVLGRCGWVGWQVYVGPLALLEFGWCRPGASPQAGITRAFGPDLVLSL